MAFIISFLFRWRSPAQPLQQTGTSRTATIFTLSLSLSLIIPVFFPTHSLPSLFLSLYLPSTLQRRISVPYLPGIKAQRSKVGPIHGIWKSQVFSLSGQRSMLQQQLVSVLVHPRDQTRLAWDMQASSLAQIGGHLRS